MSRDTLYVSVGNRRIRTYGGNRSDVRRMYLHYSKMNEEQFKNRHKLLSGEKFEDVKISMSCSLRRVVSDEEMNSSYDEIEDRLNIKLNYKQKEMLRWYYIDFNTMPSKFIRQVMNRKDVVLE